MAGTPASFCGPGAVKDRTGPADPDFMTGQVAKQWDGVAPADADLDQAIYLAGALTGWRRYRPIDLAEVPGPAP